MASSILALVSDGIVVNRAVADPDTEEGQAWLAAVGADYDAVIDLTAASPSPGIGWSYASETFTQPVPPGAKAGTLPVTVKVPTSVVHP